MTADRRWYRELPARAWWIAIGWLMVAAIVVGSLATVPAVGPDLPQGDKLQHVAAYFALTAWFAQISARWRVLLVHALGFVLLGATLEVLQALNPGRRFELADMVANAVGVLLGLGLARSRARGLLADVVSARRRRRGA